MPYKTLHAPIYILAFYLRIDKGKPLKIKSGKVSATEIVIRNVNVNSCTQFHSSVYLLYFLASLWNPYINIVGLF